MSAPVDVLARAMCEAYARNSGNNFKEHFDTRAATIWMQQALEEVGVAELIEAAKDVLEISGGTPEHARMYAALARLGALP